MQVENLLYKAEKPSLRLSTLFWSSVPPPSVHGLTSNLHEMKHLSSGIAKFIFKALNCQAIGTKEL